MIHRLKISLVSLAIVVLGCTLCCGATPEQVATWIAEAKAELQTPVALPSTLPIVEATTRPRTWLTAADLPADAQPTPMAGVAAGLAALNPQPGEVLVDFGCGFDARWLITACRLYGTQRAIGVEIDPAIAESARRYVAHAGLSDRITIITGDATKVSVTADVGVAYLWPETLVDLRPQIAKLDRFVSYGHPITGSRMVRSDVHLYLRPVQFVRRSTATWNGRQYSGPVCSRPNCTMCAAIRQQLATPVAVQTQATAAPARSGHWQTFKRCQNGRCTTYRVWVED